MFNRAKIRDSGGLEISMRASRGFVSNASVKSIATDGDVALAASDLSGGIVQLTGFTGGHNLTTPTAAAILAAAPDMDIGDSFELRVSMTVAFAATWVAGDGNVTLKGRATVPASTSMMVIVTKTSATTVDWMAV